ncbi:Protein O-GlcNAcase [Halotydeus destructor]|nr:Protein O-GlcNAcase [Halotydeus destructor]
MGEDNNLSLLSSRDDDSRPSDFICGVVEGFYGRPWSTEQRRCLFARMKSIGLNTYMYAPKDDFKHRAYWREPYSVEEAEQLSGLISSAKENGITFVYALSPGLDIQYSNPKEVTCLKRKLEQVSQFGCTAFALLFDDIEPEISQTDKEVFQSFAQAQVSVTNEVYQNLGQPKFLFCPTEYCAARAVPNVRNSEYLTTIGMRLINEIDIMWTGNKVISKVITVESMQELAETLKRKPVIWDNLHANDYDQKRVFLGPYAGRSTDLIPYLRGVLTNPNCEFECNFIAFSTIAMWSKCSSDAKAELSSVSSDIRLETEGEGGEVEDIPLHMSSTTYHPKYALKMAIQEWLPEFSKPKSAFGRVSNAKELPLATVVANLSMPPPVLQAVVDESAKDDASGIAMSGTATPTGSIDSAPGSQFTPITKELVNSLVEPPVILNPLLEPMDCALSPADSSKSSDANMDEASTKPNSGKASETSEEMQTEPIEDENLRITLEDVTLLVDLFYLPFEHGSHGMQFLNEFQWLKANGHLVTEYRKRKQPADTGKETPEVLEWCERARKFEDTNETVARLVDRLTFIKNRTLLYELYSYIWDVKGVISLLSTYVKWLALGKTTTTANGFVPPAFSWFSPGYKEAYACGDQEPWLFRGGLTGELQRLLPVESASDLFVYKPPDSPARHLYTIRPFLPDDEESVYKVYSKSSSCDSELEAANENATLLGDYAIGDYLCLSPEFCFVVEDEVSICGYAVAAVDAVQHYKRMKMSWLPDLASKHPVQEKNSETPTADSHSLIKKLHEKRAKEESFPESVIKTHPSLIHLDILPHIVDPSVSKRLLACTLAALKANGSTGVFAKGHSSNKGFLELYSKLGFQQAPAAANDEPATEDKYFIRTI